ncbi:hypothetical protein [Bacillus sp. AFS017336]|uniref:hypothetical protein n=1 Tax=Bacillus sp. AFS017336 TaxID=2033489 RepID=UPI000BEF28EF|nr:hypothetical protein [Bacillus sp. AFS017336]PEL07805.1 hypothetical protein CN601_19130 [Bacillus sp. AFS017336]
MISNWIKNKSERKLIYIALVIAVIIFFLATSKTIHRTDLSMNIGQHIQHGLHEKDPLKFYAKDKGSLGRLGVFAAFILFPLYFIIRLKKLKDYKELKRFLSKLLKWCKLIHVPIALITFALVTVHSVIMTFFEWKTDAVYVSGVITYLLLLPLGIFGFLRYKRKDKNWHYYLSFAVVISMLIHTFI